MPVPLLTPPRMCVEHLQRLQPGLPHLLQVNPALRPHKRAVGGRGVEKVWPNSPQVLLIAERAALVSGRQEEFVPPVAMAWTGMR